MLEEDRNICKSFLNRLKKLSLSPNTIDGLKITVVNVLVDWFLIKSSASPLV